MELYAGYDGGGTKTACLLSNEKGDILGFGTGGPSNYLFCGKETAAASCRAATEAAFRQAGLPVTQLQGAYMASAAILLQHGDSHVPFFSTCIDSRKLTCESDIYPIWFGAAQGDDAIVSIAGTGAVTYFCSQKGFVRVGGWGPLLGDEGSGYDLGLQALRRACRMYDGRQKKDALFCREIFSSFGVENPRELLILLNKGDTRSKVASAAKCVFSLYDRGCEEAGDLLERCAGEIALAIETALDQVTLSSPCPVVLSGGIVSPGSPLHGMVAGKLSHKQDKISDIRSPGVSPAAASAALALWHDGRREAAQALLKNAQRWSV